MTDAVKWSELPERQSYNHSSWDPIPGRFVSEVQERCEDMYTFGCTLCGALVDNIGKHTEWHAKQGD